MRIGAIVTVGIVLALGSIAHAGSWQVSYAGGTSTFPVPPYSHAYSNSDGSYGGGGTGASGTIVATVTWKRSFSGDLPPATAFVQEDCTAFAISEGTLLIHADSGLDGKSSATSPGSGVKYLRSVGQRITYIPLMGAESFQVSASPSASGSCSATVSYKVIVASFAVNVNSSRDETFYKSAGGAKLSNLTGQVTPEYGDIGVGESERYVEYSDDHLYESVSYPFSVTFTRELIGPWTNPLHEWSAPPESWRDDLLHEWESVTPSWSLTSDELESLAYGPKTLEVTLKATNNGGSGTAATGVYRLRVHNEFSNWRLDTEPSHQRDPIHQAVENFTIDSPGYADGGGGINCHWYVGSPYWTMMRPSGSALVKVTAVAVTNPIYKAGFAIAGIVADALGPTLDNGVAPWAWEWEGSTIDGSWDDDPAFYRMIPGREIEYALTPYACDQYGPNGYVGPAGYYKALPDGGVRWTGEFIYAGEADGGPH